MESQERILKDIEILKRLIVDLNELNILVKDTTFDDVYFIDVDSYQTKSFPATAIMDSIRDRHATSYTNNTDWFSYGILSFQLFTGIHPFKGKHNKYSLLDDRMLHNISVFNKEVSIPPIVSLTSIPQVYKDWYIALFEEGKRLGPPSGVATVAVRTTTSAIKGKGIIKVTELYSFDSDVSQSPFSKGKGLRGDFQG